MKWTPWILVSLTVFTMGACGGERRENGASDTGSESGTMQGGASTDTAVPGTGGPGTTSDTAQGGAYLRNDTARSGNTGTSDSARGNQTESGVTDTRTGKSTLGRGVTETRPDQSEPVTSKGDTVGHPEGH
jgi:hypothetical protein